MNLKELNKYESLRNKAWKYFVKKVLLDIQEIKITDLLKIEDGEIIDLIQKLKVRMEEIKTEKEIEKFKTHKIKNETYKKGFWKY